MTEQEITDLKSQIDGMRAGIREIAHDLSNPLGVIRMTAYYLQVAQPDKAKQDHYFKLMNDTVDKMEAGLKRLRSLVDAPAVESRPGEPPTPRP
jgi:nitrogen-specific signal transduction histidine kinase